MFKPKEKISDEAVLAKFREGLSVNAVAKHFGLSWARARELRAGFLTAGQLEGEYPEPAASAAAGDAAEDAAGDAAEDDGPQVWTVHTDVPAEQLDALLNNVTHDDALAYLMTLDEEQKAAAWQFFLQRLVDRFLEPMPAAAELSLPFPQSVVEAIAAESEADRG